MKKFSMILVAATLGMFLVAGSAWALPFNSNRPLGLPAGFSKTAQIIDRINKHIRRLSLF